MDSSPTKSKIVKNGNGIHHMNGLIGSKNRLRIQGTAVLERDNQPNITATYDYSTACANEFFEEDVNQLQCFELNKVALGMTIYKKDQIGLKKNGHQNGNSVMLHKISEDVPMLTDVIWSRMDIAHPHSNPNAYIIKQYYSKEQDPYLPHAELCNNFLCGFLSCCLIIGLAYLFVFLTREWY
ncbi:hypothetical protein Ocin01_09720 [Orchesella cincta]|uniref:Uncharacterized protein n=1 Tax=Orchesella cincta TaxID=48709 RepID=A0A1D2MVM4_ORCCI|nr:hypothetical protein Ocin01_09720 [Orchesella cincta]